MEVAIYSNNKVLSSLDGALELKESEKVFIPKELDRVIKVVQKNIKKPIKDIYYQRGDLVPNYSVNTYLDTYNPKSKKPYRFFIGSGLSYLNDNMYGKISEGVIRSTVLIDPDGNVAKHWRRVKAKGHADQVRKALTALQAN